MTEQREFIGTTVGLQVYGEHDECLGLLRVEFYRQVDGSVQLVAVNGHNLGPAGFVATVSAEAYEDRPSELYDDLVEARWAFRQFGMSLAREAAVHDDDDDLAY